MSSENSNPPPSFLGFFVFQYRSWQTFSEGPAKYFMLYWPDDLYPLLLLFFFLTTIYRSKSVLRPGSIQKTGYRLYLAPHGRSTHPRADWRTLMCSFFSWGITLHIGQCTPQVCGTRSLYTYVLVWLVPRPSYRRIPALGPPWTFPSQQLLTFIYF